MGLHFQINTHLPKNPYLFYPYVALKNCVRNINNSQKQFGILFGVISQNSYKSIQNKFSDNLTSLQNPKIQPKNLSKLLKNKHYSELTLKLHFLKEILYKITLKNHSQKS